ncbi:MAG: MFS transporter [Syntrophomonadaceae bacterium]|nr:MFS transporter [Syntrophomonadaceae bacterium]MDH7497958.1 MFS transporter [Syntrophomonadaceae bacterium]
MQSKWPVLAVVSIGIFMSTLDGSIVNIANPSIAARFGVSIAQVQWVTTAYIVVITSTLLLFGWVGDRIGSHRIYTWGFVIFSLGSWLCSTSTSLAWLATHRCFQGLGASMMMATGVGLITNAFPAEQRGKALGISGTVVGMGNMVGPGLGGLLVGSFGWPSIFLINVPLGIVGSVLGWHYLQPTDTARSRSRFDLAGGALLAATLVTMMLALAGAASPAYVLLGLAAVLGSTFVWVESRVREPLLDWSLLRIPAVARGNLLAGCNYLGQMFAVFLMPFYLEKAMAFPPTRSGLFMTVLPAAMAVTAPVAGSLSDRFGPDRLVSLALFTMTAAFSLLSDVTLHTPLVCTGGALALLGVGIGMFGSPNNNSMFSAAPRHKAGYLGGLVATVRNLFFALGVVTSAALFTWFMPPSAAVAPDPAAFSSALAATYRVAAGITLAGFLLSLCWRRPLARVTGPR